MSDAKCHHGKTAKECGADVDTRHAQLPDMTKKPTILEALRKDEYRDRPEIQALMNLRNAERAAEVPHPQCCDTAKKYLFAYQGLDWNTESVRNDEKPSWRSSFSSSYLEAPSTSDFLLLTFCPFCGTRLPDMQRRKNPPPVIQAYTNFDCCATCKESIYCFCSYPEAAWEPCKS